MKIKEIKTYPIKSLRGVSVPSSRLTVYGLPYDRRFMLLKADTDGSYKNMHVCYHAAMALFTPTLTYPEDSPDGIGRIEVTHRDPATGAKSTLTVPLEPEVKHLEAIDVLMHNSGTTALCMPDEYSAWFSKRFGFEVVFAYLGKNYRPVLGNLAPNSRERNPIRRQQAEKARKAANGGWLSGLVNGMPGLPSVFSAGVNGDTHVNGDVERDRDYDITFADCAPYLLASQTSLENVSARLESGDMEMEKFRPNIIVEGAEEAWDEDYWAEVTVRAPEPDRQDLALQLTANCVRCNSINVDYATGTFTGDVLKRLQKDRRVDAGHKYGPVFGRYTFIPHATFRDGKRLEIKVGDEIVVSRRNDSRTVLMWPGLGQTPKEDLYPVPAVRVAN